MQTFTRWLILLFPPLLTSNNIFADIDLQLSMTADKSNVKIYENVTYTLTVTNSGDETATGIGIEFPLPPNTAYTGSTTSKGNYAQWTKTWSINTLEVGESASMDLIAFTLSANVLRKAFAEVITADQADTDSTPNNNFLGYPTEDDEAQKTVLAIRQGERDMRLEIRADQEQTSIGDEVRLLMTFYSDDTETAGPAVVKAYLPEGFSLSYASGYGFYDRYSNEWVIPTDITGGNIFFMELIGETTNIDQPLIAFAEIIAATHPDSDSTPNNDNGEFTPNDEDDEGLVEIQPYTGLLESDLEMTVNVNVFPPDNPSDPATFGAFFVVRNTGPANNKDIWIDIEIPEGVDITEESTTPGYLPYTLGEDWYISFIPNDGQFIVRIGGTITDPTIPLTFYAEVREAAYPDSDSTPDNNATQIPNEDDEDSFTIPPSNGTKPDLEASLLDVTPDAIQQGETLEVEFTAQNVNGVAAPASKVHIWLDDELNYSPYHSEVELSLGMEDIPALEVEESVTLTKTYTIPNGFASGEYRVYIKADGDDQIDEDIEENVQVFNRAITIGGTIPNLFVRDINVSGVLAEGGMVTISCEIGNGGVAIAPTNTLKYYLSKNPTPSSGDIFIGSDNVPELNVGGLSQHSIDFEIPDLSNEIPYFDNLYYFICFADANEEIEEEYEIDNIGTSFNFIEEAKPNLVPRNPRYIGQANGNPLFLTCEVENRGTVTSSNAIYSIYQSTDAILSSDDQLKVSTQLPGLLPGETTTIGSISQGLAGAEGDYYLIWDLDVNETQENDNRISLRITKDPVSTSEAYFLQHYGTAFSTQLEETPEGYELLNRFPATGNENDSYTLVKMDRKGNFRSDGNPIPSSIPAETALTYHKRIDSGFAELGNRDNQTIYIAKRNELGAADWINNYQLNTGLEIIATDIEATADSGFIATGVAFTDDEVTYQGEVYERRTGHVFALKVSSNGNEEWFNVYKSPIGNSTVNFHYESGIQLTQLQNGSFAIAAYRGIVAPSGPPVNSFDGGSIIVHEIAADGNQIGVEGAIGQLGAYVSVSELIPTSDGGYLYTYLLNYAGNGGQIAFATKKGGSQSWEYALFSSKFGRAYFNDVVQTNDGGYMLMGDYTDAAAPDNPPANFFKLNATGELQWTNHIGRIADVLIQTNDGGFLIAGADIGESYAQKLDSETNPTPPIETEGIDIELEYTVNESTYRQWQRVEYTLTATNNGTETATNLVISDPIPFGMAFTSKVASKGTYNLWFQTWTIPELAAGETATLDLILFTLINDATIVKFAQVKSMDQMDVDSTPDNNSTTIPQEDDETAVSIAPIGGSGGGKNVLDNPIDQAGALKLYQMFPVPSNDVLNIVFGTAGFQVNLLLYDVQGKLLERKSLRVNQGENALQLEVGYLTAGFYTVSLETPEGFVRGKFLKQ